MFTQSIYHQFNIEFHSNMVIGVNSNVYNFGSMTLNTTHMRGKGVYIGWMTLKLDRCVCVMYLHMCAKFHGSMTKSLRESPFGVPHLQCEDIPQNFISVSKSFSLVSQPACSQSTLVACWWLAPTAPLFFSYFATSWSFTKPEGSPFYNFEPSI